MAVALVAAAPASATTTENFHATFHDVAFQNSCVPPIVFCGSGVIDSFGPATTIVRVTRNVPIPGTNCADVAGLRQMILDDGSGTLVTTFTGTRCPLGEGGHASNAKHRGGKVTSSSTKTATPSTPAPIPRTVGAAHLPPAER